MRVPDEIRKCAHFVMYNSGEEFKFAGTGFFIGLAIPNHSTFSIFFAVTAKHVIEESRRRAKDDCIYLRLNRKNGELLAVKIPFDDWIDHPGDKGADVSIAAVPWHEEWDHLAVSPEAFVTGLTIEEHEIGVGDAVSVTGMFSRHTGSKRNVPIVRTGNIAAMREETISIKLKDGSAFEVDAYLIETRSFGGLSGSPVFVNLGDIRRIGGIVRQAEKGPVFKLLGLVFGHWNEEVSIPDVSFPLVKQVELLNLGMSIVVPTDRLAELLKSENVTKILVQASVQLDSK